MISDACVGIPAEEVVEVFFVFFFSKVFQCRRGVISPVHRLSSQQLFGTELEKSWKAIVVVVGDCTMYVVVGRRAGGLEGLLLRLR